MGFPGGSSGKEPACQSKRHKRWGLDPWVRKIQEGMAIHFSILAWEYWESPCSSDGKESAWNAGDLGLIPQSGRSPGEGNGNTLQYSCLGNSMDWGAWWATVHGVEKSDTTERLTYILAWRVPWTEESGGRESRRWQESDTTEKI